VEEFYTFTTDSNSGQSMSQLLGEFECRLDPKGRLMIPAGLKRQLPPDLGDKLVINRGFENCLILYPYPDWQRESEKVNRLNVYNKKNREFVRYFYRGATELLIDSTGRILLPKPLLDYAGIDKELVLSAFGYRIEVWSKEAYDKMLTNEPGDFSDLAEEVMGDKIGGGADDIS